MAMNLLENWHLKLLSFSFALILWFFVMGEQRSEVGMMAPLELVNIPEGLMVANEVPSLVDLRISGPRTLLMNVNQKDLTIAVDLDAVKPGITSFRRLEERLELPSGMKVTRMSPSYVDIKLDRVTEKTVPVRINLVGQPEPGFSVTSFLARPAKVRLKGAEGELKDIREVETEAVSVENLNAGFKVMTAIAYQGKYSKLVDDFAVEVSARIDGAPVEEGPLAPMSQKD